MGSNNHISNSAHDFTQRAEECLGAYRRYLMDFKQFCLLSDWENADRAAENAISALQAHFDSMMAAYKCMGE